MTRFPQFALGLMLVLCTFARADDVKIKFHVTVPSSTPPNAKLYLSGNASTLGNWNGAGVELTRQNEGFEASVSLPKDQPVEFKVTRGGWETVEKNADASEMANRKFTPTKDGLLPINVAAWADGGKFTTVSRPSTRSGDIRLHPFHSTVLNNDRKLWVYLPPDYGKTTTRYSVFYLQDGQNLFDASTSFAGEWQADETSQKLIEQKQIEPVILVGIENTRDRMKEYSPVVDQKLHTGGGADLYAKMLLVEVKSFVDQTYRTLPDRAHTGIGGSSLGGLVSLYIAQKYPDAFSKVAAISPSLSWGDHWIFHQIESDPDFPRNTRIWLDMGTVEGEGVSAQSNVDDVMALTEIFKKHDVREGSDFHLMVVEGAHHNEQAWAARFDKVLRFLFPPVPTR